MQYLNDLLTELPCGWLDFAKACSKGDVAQLNAISADLANRYSLYAGFVYNYRVDLVATAFSEHRAILVSYYEKAPASLNQELLNRRNGHGLYLCPFCGNPQKPDTLDHFIPKGKWPEFSIFSNNLVPQCRGCAPIKGENYYCHEKNIAKFIHPIYSDLLQKFRYKISVDFDSNKKTPSFSVVLIKNQDTVNEEDQRVMFHVKNLKVKGRIIKFCQDDYRRWKTRLKKNRFDLRLALQQRLSEIPVNDLGRDWKSAFCEGLLENEVVVNYLHSLRPQEKLESKLLLVEEFEL